jgi:MutS domain V
MPSRGVREGCGYETPLGGSEAYLKSKSSTMEAPSGPRNEVHAELSRAAVESARVMRWRTAAESVREMRLDVGSHLDPLHRARMKMPVTNDPAAAYAALLSTRQRDAAEFEGKNARFAYARLAIAISAAVLVWLALSRGYSILWVLVPVCAFVVLMMAHERVQRRVQRLRRAEAFFERGLARLNGEWEGHGETGERYLDPAHPYAQDLDLFGKGSLFELLSSARTHIGEATLAKWLLAPESPEGVRARQAAAEELRAQVDLREQLAVLAEDARTGVDPVSLAHWGEAAPQLAGRGLRASVWAFRILGIAGLAAGFVGMIAAAGFVKMQPWAVVSARDLFLLALAVNCIFYYRNRAPMEKVVAVVEEAAHELRLVADVLGLLEKQSFRAPLLMELRASLDTEHTPPSVRLARLGRVMDYLDSRENIFVKLMEPFVLWTPYWAIRVEEWRKHSGPAVRRWLGAMGEMEALSSIAGYAFEHPGDPFPELLEGGSCFEAEGVAHPLIPEARAVRNDVAIGGELRIAVVSGSNMSGKSTLLRTVGINTVLAQMGAPVRARRMRLSPLAVGASIRLNDSLREGVSRFYAEILRLRQILDLTVGPLPVLFLIDEFMHGTNSHDRRIGAEAMARGLVQRGAIGLITTHDLALASIADELGPKAANVHFEDSVENGEIHFDYRMRPGVVRKSNAIELMRSVGLEV